MNKQEEAKKVIDLWLLAEFLTQESFPEYKKDSRNIKKDIKKKEIYTRWTEEPPVDESTKGILDIASAIDKSTYIEQDSEEPVCEQKSIHNLLSEIGNNYVIAGKIQRNDIFQLFKKCTKFEDDIENLVGEVALFSMKLNSEGYYEVRSLQISPLVLMIHFIYESNNKEDIRGKIQKKNLDRFIKKIENILIEKVIKDSKISYNTLLEVQKKISDLLLNKTFLEIKSEVLLIYPRFIDKEEIEENLQDYSCLSRSFYKEELDYMESKVDEMKEQLLDYILVQHKELDMKSHKRKRVDVLNDESFIKENLDVSLESAGKWPSKYSPSFMQQMAIHKYNALCSESKNAMLSVNGPPGTGKTTMLKEIIVDNIVKRASILSSFSNSSDAFEEVHFSDGDKLNNGYVDYAQTYFKFKDEKLLEHNMLVVSSNNAAVENITKELPSKVNLLNEIDVLIDTQKLFDISKSNHSFKIKDKINDNEKKEFDVKDIYFSVFADQLKKKRKLTNKAIKNKNIDEENIDKEYIDDWGLISTALGKKDNIFEFNKYALTPIIFQISTKEENDYNDCFQNAKKDFKEQKIKVNKIGNRLKENIELEEKAKRLILEIKYEIKCIDDNIDIKNKKLSKLRKEEKLKQLDCQSLENAISKKITYWSQTSEYCSIEIFNYEEFNSLFQQAKSENDISEKNCSQMNKRLLGRFFKNKSYVEYKKGQEKLSEFENFENIVLPEYTILSNRKKALEQIQSTKSKICYEIKTLTEQKEEKAEEIQNIENKTKEYIANLEKDGIKVFNNKFFCSLKSNDDESRLKAHLKNLWTSSEFNREREKLFRYALDVHKYFILSSPEVRKNFCNLKVFWSLEKNVRMSNEDKETSFIHLLNTLFLLVPVISTTFASVGNFLKHAKEQSSIGNLIIDEAGQANPQFALGALWRAKNTIIVGDPKQIEPVVTSDVKLLLKIFAPDNLENYSLDNNSVQSFADQLNPYGNVIGNTWVGFPLIVHRRCIEPMFKISNTISYNKTMLLASGLDDTEQIYAIEKSGFFSIVGTSKGNKNHYIEEQAKLALEYIEKHLENNKCKDNPSIFVISPFTTVIKGFKELARNSDILRKHLGKKLNEWIKRSCGTVHTFQGREADEVIFLLGCDKDNGSGAVRWVNSNIVNVAVTRAKRRILVIGDKELWINNPVVSKMIESLEELNNAVM